MQQQQQQQNQQVVEFDGKKCHSIRSSISSISGRLCGRLCELLPPKAHENPSQGPQVIADLLRNYVYTLQIITAAQFPLAVLFHHYLYVFVIVVLVVIIFIFLLDATTTIFQSLHTYLYVL